MTELTDGYADLARGQRQLGLKFDRGQRELIRVVNARESGRIGSQQHRSPTDSGSSTEGSQSVLLAKENARESDRAETQQHRPPSVSHGTVSMSVV